MTKGEWAQQYTMLAKVFCACHVPYSSWSEGCIHVCHMAHGALFGTCMLMVVLHAWLLVTILTSAWPFHVATSEWQGYSDLLKQTKLYNLETPPFPPVSFCGARPHSSTSFICSSLHGCGIVITIVVLNFTGAIWFLISWSAIPYSSNVKMHSRLHTVQWRGQFVVVWVG